MRQLKGKYSARLAVFAFPVLAVIALFFIRTQTTKRAVVVEQADRSPEQISAVPAVVTTGGKEDMRPREGNAHPFCAPGSTVYLTQAQQEYKLGKRGHNTPDVKDAKKNGANAKVTLRVVDSLGNPVPDANVQVVFFHRGSYTSDGKTDANGFFTAEHMSESDVHFYASKVGYYNTQRNYWFYREGKPCAENGRWIPWNPTLEVVLKEKRNPIKMEERSIALRMPEDSGRFGFDFIKGDWVKPHGDGINVDVWIESVLNPKTKDLEATWEHRLTFDFPNEGDGLSVYVQDRFSQMHTSYEAPNEGYAQKMSFIRAGKGHAVHLDRRLQENEGMMFRVRTRQQDGQLNGGYYGLTVGEFQFPAGPHVRANFRYLINPNEGDQNLEAKSALCN